MKTLTTTVLENVSGGAKKSSEITTALNGIQTGLKDALSSKSSSSSGMDPTMMLVLAMTMGQKNNGPTVVAAPGACPAQSGPIVNISTRVRRGW